jgi:hypothetical protein
MNRFAYGKKDRTLARKGGRLGFLVLVALGAMILLLSGCGSESTPKVAATGKKEKAAPKGMDIKTITPLLSDKGGGTGPTLPQVDKLPGMPPPEELEAKRAAAAAAYEKLDPKRQVLPGLTKEQLEAKIEAERAKRSNPKREILPGLTAEQLDAKLKAQRERPATPMQVLPGLTQEQVKAKAAQARQIQETTKGTRPEHVLPPK